VARPGLKGRPQPPERRCCFADPRPDGARGEGAEAGRAAIGRGGASWWSRREAVRHYIEHQDEHHRRETFQEEFRRFLDISGTPYDERYLW